MSYLFVFRTFPDVDHMVPLAWKLLEQGEEVHAVVSPGYDASGDVRLRHLRRYERFTLTEVWPAGDDSPRAAAAGWARSTLAWALGYIVRHDVRVVCVEWGYGLAAGYERPFSIAGGRAIGRSLARSLKLAHTRDPHQTRVNFIVAARLLGRANVCLPHGLSIKLDAARPEVVEAFANGGLDWRDRNRFDAYVLNTEHHRRMHLDHMRGDPEVMQTWGSMRWAPEWVERNRELAADWQWPGARDGDLKVVFMVPKWKNRVRPEPVIELVQRLQEEPGVALAVKGHPRPADGSSDPLREDARIDWSRIVDAARVESVPLIAAADVVVDIGSSIGIEVVMQGRGLVNPAYLHEIRTLFDDIDGSSVVAQDADEVIAYLHRHRAGDPHRPSEEVRRELLRRAVYGDRPEPFDVLGLYAGRVRELAERGSPRPSNPTAEARP